MVAIPATQLKTLVEDLEQVLPYLEVACHDGDMEDDLLFYLKSDYEKLMTLLEGL